MEISESVWAKAKEVVSGMGLYKETHFMTLLYEAAARAIMTERRECAEIADLYAVSADNRKKLSNNSEDSFDAAIEADACRVISQAIRNK